MLLQFRGELAALTAALIWAAASLIYTGIGEQLTPIALNFTKGWIAIVFFILTLWLTHATIPAIEITSFSMLFLSGVVGIGFGDTAYFNALNCIGARRTLLFETLAPPLSAIGALLFLQEQLSVQAWFGIGLTILGVIWTILERAPDQTARFRPLQGAMFGLLAALGQSCGAVLSRAALINTEIDSTWSTLIRLLGGTIALLIWILIQRQEREMIKPVRSRRLLLVIAGTAFISTYLGIWLQQTSLKYAATGIAQALSSTSPVFVLPIAKLMGDQISLRSIVGVLIALIGVSLLFQRF